MKQGLVQQISKEYVKNKLLGHICENCYYYKTYEYDKPKACSSLLHARLYENVKSIGTPEFDEFKRIGNFKKNEDTCKLWMIKK